jgi:hypothetical protein
MRWPGFRKAQTELEGRCSLKRGPVLVAIACAIVASVALTACGGGDDAKPTATLEGQTATAAAGGGKTNDTTGTTAVCSLVTFAEVTAELGEASTDRASTEPPVQQEVSSGVTAYVSSCQYSNASGLHTVKLDLWQVLGDTSKIKQLTASICSGKEVVSGLGDVACWYDSGHREIQLSKGGGYIDMKSSTGGDPLQALAEKAIARLP